MNIRQSLRAQVLLLILSVIHSLVAGRNMPDVVPTHWGIDGKPDAYGSPAMALWFGPGMLVFMALLTWALPKLSPRKFEIDRFERTYGLLMFLVSLMMAALSAIILRATLNQSVDIGRGIMIVLGLFFALFGNLMGKVRRNFFMGIRTPWTLASERVWDATHRHAAGLWFAGGLVVVVLALLGIPIAGFVVIMAMAFWPILDSYRLYRRLEGR